MNDLGRVNIKLNSVLSFDEAKEADIVAKVNCLTKQHKLGKLLNELIRVYFENPSIFSQPKVDKRTEKTPFREAVPRETSVDSSRQKFFSSLSKKVDEMQKKIDAISEMTQQLLTLAQFNKALGLEERTESIVLASFILQKQLYELEDVLGIEGIDLSVRETYQSNLDREKQKADDTLQFIINTYGEIFSALKTGIDAVVNPTQVIVQAPVQQVVEPATQLVSTPAIQDVTPAQPIRTAQGVTQTASTTQVQQDEYLDFGDAELEVPDFDANADMNLMNLFLGNS